MASDRRISARVRKIPSEKTSISRTTAGEKLHWVIEIQFRPSPKKIQGKNMLRNRFNQLGFLLLLSAVTTASIAGPPPGKGGGKGGGGDDGGGGAASPILYEVTFFGNLGGSPFYVSDINNRGDIVGSGWDGDDFTGTRRAWVLLPTDLDNDGIVDYSNDLLVDINLMHDLDGNPTVPPGWRANRAESINENGEVAGTLWDEASGLRATFTLELSSGTLTIIDVNTGQDAEINDNGEVAYAKIIDGIEYIHVYVPGQGAVNLGIMGTVHGFNNSGQIVGWDNSTAKPFRYTPGETLLDVGGFAHAFVGLNELGETTLFGDHRKKPIAYRYSDFEGLHEIASGAGMPTDINLHGDVLIERYDVGTLYRDDLGLLALDDLVGGANGEVAMWFARDRDSFSVFETNDRNETGFGVICGVHSFNGAQIGFVLRPVPVP